MNKNKRVDKNRTIEKVENNPIPFMLILLTIPYDSDKSGSSISLFLLFVLRL
jgi:hypothetical protein